MSQIPSSESSTRIGPNVTAQSEQMPMVIQVEPPASKPGYYTSEFWQGIISQLAGLGLLVFGIKTKESEYVMLGASLLGLSSSAYAISRGLAKKG